MIKEKNNINDIEYILKEYFPSYNSNDPYEKILIFEENEKVIGIISYSIIYERAEINYLLTIPSYRNKGVATKLLKQAIDKIKTLNCETISLEVEENNIPAINLYKKYGFIKQAIRKNYYKNNDGFLMIKELR